MDSVVRTFVGAMDGAKLVLVRLFLILQHHHHLLVVVVLALLHFADQINKCVLVMINVVQRPAGPMEDVRQQHLLLEREHVVLHQFHVQVMKIAQ